MGADQLPLPHLGPQARLLLDRIVASGARGVDQRDTDDWVLSRLIELRYAEASPLDSSAFVCTSAGKRRWQMEIVADERRQEIQLRRQLIRHRLDERFSSLGMGTSTALATICSPVENRGQYGVPALSDPPPGIRARLASALAALFATASVAVVATLGSAEPQDVREWLFPQTVQAVTAQADPPQANAEQAAQVAAPVAATVTAPPDTHVEEVAGPAVALADAAPPDTQQPAAAAPDIVAPVQPEQVAKLPDTAPARVAETRQPDLAVADSASPVDAAFDRAAVTAAALIDTALSETGRFATDVATGVERSFGSIAAALLHTAAEMDSPVAAPVSVAQQTSDEVPAVVAPVVEPVPDHETPALLQPVIASGGEVVRPAVVHAAPEEHVTHRTPAVRADEPSVDPQHTAVERLNALSLAAARRGEAWRPNSARKVTQRDRPL